MVSLVHLKKSISLNNFLTAFLLISDFHNSARIPSFGFSVVPQLWSPKCLDSAQIWRELPCLICLHYSYLPGVCWAEPWAGDSQPGNYCSLGRGKPELSGQTRKSRTEGVKEMRRQPSMARGQKRSSWVCKCWVASRRPSFLSRSDSMTAHRTKPTNGRCLPNNEEILAKTPWVL